MDAAFDALIARVRFPSLMLPELDASILDGLPREIDRLAQVAAVLASVPTPHRVRRRSLEQHADRARAVARILPQLDARERSAWAIGETVHVIDAIERCRADGQTFPRALEELLFDVRLRVDALVRSVSAA